MEVAADAAFETTASFGDLLLDRPALHPLKIGQGRGNAPYRWAKDEPTFEVERDDQHHEQTQLQHAEGLHAGSSLFRRCAIKMQQSDLDHDLAEQGDERHRAEGERIAYAQQADQIASKSGMVTDGGVGRGGHDPGVPAGHPWSRAGTRPPRPTIPVMPMPQLLDLVKRSGTWLVEKGIGNGLREAEWIFMEALQLSRLDLFTRFDMPLEPAEVDRVRALIARRGKREPLAYVLGHQPFCNLTLTVTPAVLVPRPETEALIPRLIADLPAGGGFLDVGTGSGAIAIAVAQARPDVRVEATDAHADAVTVARANAERHAVTVGFHIGHLARELSGPYEVIAANLPYIGTSEQADCDPELGYEPAHALYCGKDGLGLIRELIADAPRLLTPTGILWLEHGFRQGQAIIALAEAVGLRCLVVPDGAGLDRHARISRA